LRAPNTAHRENGEPAASLATPPEDYPSRQTTQALDLAPDAASHARRWASRTNMNMNEQIADVIDKTNRLEDTLSLILRTIVEPHPKYHFLNAVLFHNTCVNFGLKVRLLKYVAEMREWKDLKFVYLDELMSIRNAFAHTSTDSNQFLITRDKAKQQTTIEHQMIIEKKLRNSWETLDRDKAYAMFCDIHDKCAQTLRSLMQKITEDTGRMFLTIKAELA
jgi:hypothetical protein